MEKVLISFANQKYAKSLNELYSSASNPGNVDTVYAYTFEWLKTTDFYKKNRYILDRPRGAGYWIWKPYLILESFKKIKDEGIVLYSDAGIQVIEDLTPLFEIAEKKAKNNRMVFRIPHVGTIHQNKMWTKRDCFILTKCNEQKYWDGYLVNGALSLWKKTEENIQFLNEWLKYIRDPRIVTDDPNMFGPNDLMFKDHRHDQSVLSLLAMKYDFEIFRDPTQFGNEELEIFSNSPYSQLFNHHRGNI